MSWRDQILQASWRGIRFRVRSIAMTVGRRTVVHEFPAQVLPMVEDLGRATRRWRVEGYIVGADYIEGRDALRQALEQPGQGELILPTIGAVQAVLEAPVDLSESPDEGGLCRFSAAWVEATDALRTSLERDPIATAQEAVAVAAAAVAPAYAAEIEAVAADYERALGVAPAPVAAAGGVSSLVPTSAQIQASVLDRVQGALGTAVDRVQDALSGLALPAEALATLRGEIGTIRSQLETLAATPEIAAQMISAVIAEAAGLASDVGSLVEWSIDPAMRLLSLLREATPEEATPIPIALAVPETRLDVLLGQSVTTATDRMERAAWVASIARQALGVDYASADVAQDVAAALDALAAAAVDAPAPSAGAAALRDAVSTASSTASAYLREVAADLPRLATHVPETTMPAVLIAQRLYGDATRADEIVRLNAVADPLRVTGGRPLQVLSDD